MLQIVSLIATKLLAGYGDVSNINLIKPAIKKYLYSNVQSGFRRIDVDEMLLQYIYLWLTLRKEVLAQYLLIVGEKYNG